MNNTIRVKSLILVNPVMSVQPPERSVRSRGPAPTPPKDDVIDTTTTSRSWPRPLCGRWRRRHGDTSPLDQSAAALGPRVYCLNRSNPPGASGPTETFPPTERWRPPCLRAHPPATRARTPTSASPLARPATTATRASPGTRTKTRTWTRRGTPRDRTARVRGRGRTRTWPRWAPRRPAAAWRGPAGSSTTAGRSSSKTCPPMFPIRWDRWHVIGVSIHGGLHVA